MSRLKVILISLIAIMFAAFLLVGCNRGGVVQNNSSSQVVSGNSSQQISGSNQDIQTLDPTVNSDLDQIDNQLNEIQSTLTTTDTLDDFK